MEMCYDGALVMPNNYAVVDEEEMMYVDGGTWMTALESAAVGLLVNVISSAVGYAKANGVRALVWECVNTVKWIHTLWVSAIEWAIANPEICLGILAGCTVAVIAYVSARL